MKAWPCLVMPFLMNSSWWVCLDNRASSLWNGIDSDGTPLCVDAVTLGPPLGQQHFPQMVADVGIKTSCGSTTFGRLTSQPVSDSSVFVSWRWPLYADRVLHSASGVCTGGLIQLSHYIKHWEAERCLLVTLWTHSTQQSTSTCWTHWPIIVDMGEFAKWPHGSICRCPKCSVSIWSAILYCRSLRGGEDGRSFRTGSIWTTRL